MCHRYREVTTLRALITTSTTSRLYTSRHAYEGLFTFGWHLGKPVRNHPDCVNWGGKPLKVVSTESDRTCPWACALGWRERRKLAENNHSQFRLPGGGWDMSSYLKLLLPWFPQCEGLHPWCGTWMKSFLPQVAFVRASYQSNRTIVAPPVLFIMYKIASVWPRTDAYSTYVF